MWTLAYIFHIYDLSFVIHVSEAVFCIIFKRWIHVGLDLVLILFELHIS